MKKILFTFLVLALNSNVYATGKNCPKGFGKKGIDHCFTIRVGTKHYFYDSFTNPHNYSIKVKKSKIIFNPEYEYDDNGSPKIIYTNWLLNRNKIIPEETYNQDILKTTKKYHFKFRPKKRSYNNLVITYIIKVIDFKNNHESGAIREQKSMAHYELSWCGDGILDLIYDEECDPNDKDQKGFGKIGCSMKCHTL